MMEKVIDDKSVSQVVLKVSVNYKPAVMLHRFNNSYPLQGSPQLYTILDLSVNK